MRAKLFCKTGELAGVGQQIGAEATIGRSAENTLVLGASVISQAHARIFFDAQAGGYVLEDLQSKNGTQLDGIRIHGRERLHDLHVVTLGEVHDFIFVVLPEPATAAADVGRAVHAAGSLAPPDPASETIHDDASVLEMPALTDARATDQGGEPGGQTVYEPPSALEVPSFEEPPGPLDNEAVSASETRHEPPSALAVPSFEEQPEAPHDEAVSAPDTMLEPPSVLEAPSFQGPAGTADSEASSGSETKHELPSALAVPSFEGTERAVGVDAPSESETVLESPSALRLPRFEADQPGSDAPVATRPMPHPAAMRAVLEVTLADRSSFRVELGDGVNAIGRAPECQVHIDDRTLSRRHGVLTIEDGTVTFEDQRSRNGTFKDGVRLTAPVRLRVGEVLTFGDQVTARLVAP